MRASTGARWRLTRCWRWTAMGCRTSWRGTCGTCPSTRSETAPEAHPLLIDRCMIHQGPQRTWCAPARQCCCGCGTHVLHLATSALADMIAPWLLGLVEAGSQHNVSLRGAPSNFADVPPVLALCRKMYNPHWFQIPGLTGPNWERRCILKTQLASVLCQRVGWSVMKSLGPEFRAPDT